MLRVRERLHQRGPVVEMPVRAQLTQVVRARVDFHGFHKPSLTAWNRKTAACRVTTGEDAG